jgi:glutamate synthase (NADPH/NADH) small chain
MTRSSAPGGERLELRLADHKPLYSEAQARVEAERCLYCHDAPCTVACPTGIDVATFIRKIATGNVRGSARTILTANLMGYSCARVCPVEVLCAGACVYNHLGREPIQIGRLQRYAVETVMDRGGVPSLLPRKPANGRKVACVGAGPASLSCAGYLALEGFACVLYEKRALPGGLNATGVAPYKMHVEGALREVDLIRDLGVTIRSGVEIGREVTGEDLLRDNDGVFLGIGLGSDTRLGAPGEDGPGVAGAVAWIERMKTDSGFTLGEGRRAVVIGGGNTAIDAARELAHLGIREVTMLYRRTAEVMRGYAHEMAQARMEGVRLEERAVVRGFERDGQGRLRGVLLEDGRRLECDLALVAIGQASLREVARQFPGVEVDAEGCIVADPVTGRTGHPRVYAGGDARNGGKEVVNAAQEGKRAARAIAVQCGVSITRGSAIEAGHP